MREDEPPHRLSRGSLLFPMQASDRLSYGGTELLLTVVALVACCPPARRAAKVDPIDAALGVNALAGGAF